VLIAIKRLISQIADQLLSLYSKLLTSIALDIKNTVIEQMSRYSNPRNYEKIVVMQGWLNDAILMYVSVFNLTGWLFNLLIIKPGM